jgi:hypothetical protein
MASYYVWSGATGSANGTTWANAYTTLVVAFTGKLAADVFYVAHDHAETTAATINLTTAGTIASLTKVICVNRSGSVPPVSADRRATATVTTSSNTGSINFAGYTHYDGIIFFSGGPSGVCGFGLPSATASIRFDNCSLRLVTTGTTSKVWLSNTGGVVATYVEFNNTTVSFAAIQQCIEVGGLFKWRNTPSAVLGTVPTRLFALLTTRGGEVECIGVDMSALGSGKTIVDAGVGGSNHKLRFIDCKLNASVTKSSAPVSQGASELDFIRVGSAGVNYSVYRHRTGGSLTEELTIVRSGGATDGTTPLSWRIDTTANSNYSLPFECPVIAIWNDTTGSAKTATIEGIASALPTDQEIWVELEYLSDASSPIGGFVNDGTPDLLTTPANQTSSSATWGGALTGKFKLGVTFTAQQKGWLYCRVKCAKPSSAFYIDPLITLT